MDPSSAGENYGAGHWHGAGWWSICSEVFLVHNNGLWWSCMCASAATAIPAGLGDDINRQHLARHFTVARSPVRVGDCTEMMDKGVRVFVVKVCPLLLREANVCICAMYIPSSTYPTSTPATLKPRGAFQHRHTVHPAQTTGTRWGGFGRGEIWNGEIWHNKGVPKFVTVF